MVDRRDNRAFLRLVLAVSIVANGAVVLGTQGERGLRPFAAASTLDRYRFDLTDEIETYRSSVETLHERVRADGEP